jgi:hypothetical protein
MAWLFFSLLSPLCRTFSGGTGAGGISPNPLIRLACRENSSAGADLMERCGAGVEGIMILQDLWDLLIS